MTVLGLPPAGHHAVVRVQAAGEKARYPLTFTRLNQQFHSVLFDPCPNPHLLELVRLDWSRLAGLRHSTFVFIPDRARDSVAEHSEILDLIRAGADAIEIEMATRLHRWRTVNAFVAARHPDTPSA